MGAGILPVAMHNNKIYFLLGLENEYNDTPGWADFGGGKKFNETSIETASREGSEELNGFFGTKENIKHLIENHTILKVDINSYITYIVKVQYDEDMPTYFNNNYIFSKKYLGSTISNKNNGLFEKQKIKWFTYKELTKETNYRIYYTKIIDEIKNNKKSLFNNLRKKNKTIKKHNSKHNKSKKLTYFNL